MRTTLPADLNRIHPIRQIICQTRPIIITATGLTRSNLITAYVAPVMRVYTSCYEISADPTHEAVLCV